MRKSTHTVYVCGNTAADLDPENSGLIEFAMSAEALYDNMTCVDQCGIVKATLSIEETIRPINYASIEAQTAEDRAAFEEQDDKNTTAAKNIENALLACNTEEQALNIACRLYYRLKLREVDSRMNKRIKTNG